MNFPTDRLSNAVLCQTDDVYTSTQEMNPSILKAPQKAFIEHWCYEQNFHPVFKKSNAVLSLALGNK